MYKKALKRIITPLFLLVVGAVYGQMYNKYGNNTFNLDYSAALEVESTERGFLPPRMTMKQRDAIKPVATGLIVWCIDCNDSTTPPSGSLCVYTGDSWESFSFLPAISPTLTTGKNGDPTNAPVRLSNTSATISGTLVNTYGKAPTETGIVYREIIGNDYTTFPTLILDASGAITAPTPPNYKAATTPSVTTSGGKISMDINLPSTTRPYYFRTYAKNAGGIGYGNPVIFNVAPPKISTPVVTNGNTLLPLFAGTLTVNAGTPRGTITEYGYCSSTTNNPPTTADNNVAISNAAAITALNAQLNSDTFTADPIVNLAVNDYVVKAFVPTYFFYYFTIDGITTYSPSAGFTPGDPVTGGSATASFNNYTLSSTPPLRIGEASTGKFLASFRVTKAGTYKFTVENPTGNTSGLSIAPPVTGSFAAADVGTDKTVDFPITGTPDISLDGNTFKISGITDSFVTGAILPNLVTGGTAVATYNSYTVSSTKPLKLGEASTSKFVASFNVTKAGDYKFTVENPTGATQGLIVSPVTGTFTLADVGTTKTIEFPITGTPSTSLDGNTFTVSGIPTPISTGVISDRDGTGDAICDGTVATTVVEVRSPTGKIWMDRNLGASRAAASIDDFKAFGCSFQWGRGNDGAASMNWTSATAGTFVNAPINVSSTASDTPGKNFITHFYWQDPTNPKLWQGVKGKNNPCPVNYRVPTVSELKDEKSTNKIMDYTTAYNSPLKLLGVTTMHYDSGRVFLQDDFRGFYQSVQETVNFNSDIPDINIIVGGGIFGSGRGLPVRCVKDYNPITSGSSVATFLDYSLPKKLTLSEESTSKFLVRFHVTKSGDYYFAVANPIGATQGLSIAPVSGTFSDADVETDKTIEFTIAGTPTTSLEGNSFKVSGITTPLSTGLILEGLIHLVTGGSAAATFKSSSLSKNLTLGEESTSKFLVTLHITKSGDYRFTVASPTGATQGLSITSSMIGAFTDADVETDKTIEFPITGTPTTSLEGNIFKVSGIPPLSTGNITDTPISYYAYCDGNHPTAVVQVKSPNTSKIWMDRNLGASRAATSYDDNFASGCLFQWGRGNDGHASMLRRERLTNSALSGTSSTKVSSYKNLGTDFILNRYNWLTDNYAKLWQGVDGVNNPCPSGYRLPTRNEIQNELKDLSFLKLVSSGGRDSETGDVSSSNTYLWTSDSASWAAYDLVIENKTSISIPDRGQTKASGLSVRCIKDKP